MVAVLSVGATIKQLHFEKCSVTLSSRVKLHLKTEKKLSEIEVFLVPLRPQN